MIAELYLARRYLFRGKARHISFIGIVACIGIALGIATLIIVISVMNGFDRDLMSRLMRFNYHLTIESFDNEDLSRIEEEIERWPEVEGASMFLQTQVFAKFEKIIVPLVVKGVDFSDSGEKKVFYQYIQETVGPEGFFVGEGLRERFFITDEFDFYPLEKSLKLKKEKVRGFFKVGLYDVDNNYLIADLEKAKGLSPNYLLFLGVRIKEPFLADEVKKRISREFGEGVFATTWIESNQVLFSALQLEKITMFIILSLIVLVAAFNIFATLTVKVVEKTKDIGILKSLGFRRSHIRSVFSLQGLLLGCMGTFLGTALGLGLCLLLQTYPFIKLPESIYYIEYLPVAIRYRDIAFIMGMGICLSYIFSLLPALKAARLAPSEALRYE
jgi:lipoprotein-releasing system permease protein